MSHESLVSGHSPIANGRSMRTAVGIPLITRTPARASVFPRSPFFLSLARARPMCCAATRTGRESGTGAGGGGSLPCDHFRERERIHAETDDGEAH